MAEELKVNIVGDASGLKGALDSASGMVTSFGTKISGIGRTATIAGGAVTAAFTKTFIDFTKYEDKLVDMAKVTDEPFDKIEEKLQGVDVKLGSSKELLEGYYQVISAGVKDPIEALDLLTVAFESGKAAHVEQATVVEGITKMMAGFEGVIESASGAADLMFSIEKEGQTTVAALVPVIGGLSKMSSDLAILPEEMAAAVAVTTKTAGSTAEAATQYQAILSGLMKPTESMADAFLKIGESVRGVGEGYVDAEEMIKDLGFVDALKKIQEHSDATGVSIADLFGRKEAMIGFSAIGAESFKTLDDTIVSVAEGVGSAKDAFNNWSETGTASIDGMKASFANLSAEIGEKVAPMITKFIDKIIELIPKITEWVESHGPLIENIAKIGVVLAVGGPVLVGIGMLVTAVGTLLSPIGLVVAAVALLATAWVTNFGGIQEKTKAVIDFIKGLFTGFITTITGIKDKIIAIIDSIIKAISRAIDAIKNVGKLKIGNVDVQGSIDQATGGSSGTIPSHASGIDYVPRTGLALLHQGEAVIPASQNNNTKNNNFSPTVNITVQGDGDTNKIKQVVNQALAEAARQYSRSGNIIPGMA